MAPAFDRSEEFALDKPACEACPNLGPDNRCRIHDRLERKGFGGCVLFDCLGAGQRVVQELYPGRSWREEPELLPEMWQALTALRAVHEQILLLQAAGKMPLSLNERNRLDALLRQLEPDLGWFPQDVVARAPAISLEAADFLRSLRAHFSG